MNAEVTALIAACIAAPVDDGPRLALADHLEEAGLLTEAGARLLRADGHWLIGGSGDARWVVGTSGLASILVPEPHPMLKLRILGSVEVEFGIVPDPPQCQYCDCIMRRGLRYVNGRWFCWGHLWSPTSPAVSFAFFDETPGPMVGLSVSARMSERDHAR